MSIEAPIFLSDLIKQVLADMSLPVSPLYAQGERGYNVAFEKIANRDLPCLCYDLEQNGTIQLQETGKAFLSYSPTLLFVDGSRQDDLVDAQAKINDMKKIAVEFMQRFIRLDAFGDFAENLTIAPTFTDRANIFDTWLSGVQLNFTFTYNPKLPTPSC